MPNDPKNNVPIKSSATMFRLLQELQDRGGAGVTELAETLDVSKSTVHNHLSTMATHEYVVQDGDEYRVGLRFLDHGSHARTRCEGFDQIKQKVREVAEETGELCQYLVPEHGKGIFIARESGQQAVQTSTRVGKRVHLHHVTAGKAVLAHMSNDWVDEIIERHGLPPKTHQTITTREDLRQELEHVREQGYAFDKEEHVRGLYAIGVPVLVEDDRLLGAISVAGPSHRMSEDTNESKLSQLLEGVTNEIELNLVYASD